MNISALNVSHEAYQYNLTPLYAETSSTVGGRLHKTWDDKIVILPKTPAQVFGERVLRPVIDNSLNLLSRTTTVMQRGFSLLDNIFTKIINPLPVAAAEEFSAIACTKGTIDQYLQQITEVTAISMKTNNPAFMTAADTLYGRFFDNCIAQEKDKQAYARIFEEHTQAIKLYEQEKEKYEKALATCKRMSPYCTSQVINRFPEFKKKADQYETVPGFFSWQIWKWPSYITWEIYDHGGYNYDEHAGRPLV